MQAGLLELLRAAGHKDCVHFAGFQRVHLLRFELVVGLRQLYPLDFVEL